MNKEFVSYEQALALKELGFDEKCLGSYSKIDKIPDFEYHNKPKLYSKLFAKKTPHCVAPLYQQAFDWFREKHQLYPEILLDQTSSPKFCYKISRFLGNLDYLSEIEWDWENIQSDDTWGMYRKHNEAEIACLDKLIQILNYENSNHRA